MSKGDNCFWCLSEVGEEHAIGCPSRRRTVVLKISFEIVMPVPESWDDEQIVFHYNLARACSSNLLQDLSDLNKRVDCLCDFTTVEFLREATPEDEEKNKVFIKDFS
jgi:hypothetical protein